MQTLQNSFKVDAIVQSGKTIDYYYTVKGEWKKFFRNKHHMRVEYEIDGVDPIPEIPQSLAAVPLIANIIPLVWLKNGVVYIDRLDEDFLNCLENVKKGYCEMYPDLVFQGAVHTTAEKNVPKQEMAKTLQLFSGGVDAFFTLFSHLEEKPVLFTVWGSDVYLKDVQGWNNVQQVIQETANAYQLKTGYARSNFRGMLREGSLTREIGFIPHGNWWFSFQHAIVLLAHAAVPAWCLGVKTVYIASSYTEKFKGKISCASDPLTDNHVRFCGAKVVHDGYDYDRLEKVYRICEFKNTSGKNVPLHVCWQSSGGKNCGICEKCCRTICEVLCAGGDPADFGFEFDESGAETVRKRLEHDLIVGKEDVESWYVPIQVDLKKTAEQGHPKKQLQWLQDMDLSKINEDENKKRLAKKQQSLMFKFQKKLHGLANRLKGMHF